MNVSISTMSCKNIEAYNDEVIKRLGRRGPFVCMPNSK